MDTKTVRKPRAKKTEATAAAPAKRGRKPKVAAAPQAEAAKTDKTIRGEAEALLKQTPALGYEDIRAKLLEMFPGANTSVKSIQWYASKMKGKGAKLPDRPKKVRAAA